MHWRYGSAPIGALLMVWVVGCAAGSADPVDSAVTVRADGLRVLRLDVARHGHITRVSRDVGGRLRPACGSGAGLSEAKRRNLMGLRTAPARYIEVP